MTTDTAWVPEACSLPTTERPLRVAELDALVTTSLREQRRVSATRVTWVLDAGAEAAARDLTARETSCCSFFSFTFGPDERGVAVEVEVPPAHVGVLDALAARVAALAGR